MRLRRNPGLRGGEGRHVTERAIDLPSGLLHLRAVRTWHAMWIRRLDEAIADAERREAEPRSSCPGRPRSERGARRARRRRLRHCRRDTRSRRPRQGGRAVPLPETPEARHDSAGRRAPGWHPAVVLPRAAGPHARPHCGPCPVRAGRDRARRFRGQDGHRRGPGTRHLMRSSRWMVTSSPGPFPSSSRTAVLTGSLCVPSPSAMKELRNG